MRELIFKADEVDVFCAAVQRLLIRGRFGTDRKMNSASSDVAEHEGMYPSIHNRFLLHALDLMVCAQSIADKQVLDRGHVRKQSRTPAEHNLGR